MSANHPTDSQRLKLLVITLVLTAVISELLKLVVNISRPCQIDPNMYFSCLPDNAYPSGHTSISFSFVYPFLGHILFPIFYVLALLIGWSRVYEGFHSWFDIGGGIAVAGLSYSIAESFVIRQKNVVFSDNERPRQLVHASVGLLLCLMIWFAGIDTTYYFVLAGTCLGILMIHMVLIGIKPLNIDILLDMLERKGTIPGEGSMYYALGILFVLGLLRGNSAAAISVILILAIGDSVSTYVGMNYGRYKLPWNKSKTLEGSIGFAVGAMCALLVLPASVTAIVILLATVVESLPRLDDNITVPIVSSLVYYLMA
ncbi:MAG: phosphatase PAP2 family protein [Methanotrichaceae archaeon]|nr:phosphatase PAP2 family protein [Methanotrichaceae archaeon]